MNTSKFRSVIASLVISPLLLTGCGDNIGNNYDELMKEKPKWKMTDESKYEYDSDKGRVPYRIETQSFIDEKSLNKSSFDKPFLIREKSIIRTNGLRDKLEDRVTTTVSLLDCKNLRYARVFQQIEDQDFNGKPRSEIEHPIDLHKPIDDMHWHSFPKDSQAGKEFCAKTSDFKTFSAPKNDVQTDWKLLKLIDTYPLKYVSVEDIKKSNNEKPFTLRIKKFEEDYVNNQKTSSIENTFIVDCKNNKWVMSSARYFANDYEFKKNPNPQMVEEYIIREPGKIKDEHWVKFDKDLLLFNIANQTTEKFLGKDILVETGICPKKVDNAK